MRHTVTIIAAAALAIASGTVSTPAQARNGTANAILGVVAGTGLGLAIGSRSNRSIPASGFYEPMQPAQPAYVPVPQPRPAPNGVACMAWNGFGYVPVARCGN